MGQNLTALSQSSAGNITAKKNLTVAGNLAVTGSTTLATTAIACADTTEASAVDTASITTVGGLGVTKKIYAGTNIVMVGGDVDMSTASTGTYDMILKDAQADALSIRRATTDMMLFDSATPKITITPAVAVTGPVVQGTVGLPLTTVTPLTSGATVTYSAAQIVGGFISDAITESCAATTATAAQIVAAITGCKVGTSFLFILKNAAASGITITLTAGSGITITGTATVGQNNTKQFLVRATNVTGSAEAVTFYSLGTMVH
jgi:hypothetical protein